jgi:hypothetical protein
MGMLFSLMLTAFVVYGLVYGQPLGRIKIGELEIWQAAGIGALVWGVTNFAYQLVDDYRRTRRLRKRS